MIQCPNIWEYPNMMWWNNLLHNLSPLTCLEKYSELTLDSTAEKWITEKNLYYSFYYFSPFPVNGKKQDKNTD